MRIRDEIPGEEAAIHALTKAAFASVAMSDGSEPRIVDRLRQDGDLALSLVAVEDEQIIGHVAFSPVTLSGSDGDWFGLGPISVHPARQRSGIGRLLVEAGLDRLRARNAHGCVLLGDPAHYARFGFSSPGDLTYGAVPTAYVQALAFKTQAAKGELHYAAAFDA
jgi:predicted N-acetyltransferase YhbS